MATDDYYFGGTDAPLSPTQLKGGAPNVTGGEKWLSIVAGGALAAVGARRGGAVGVLAIVAGSAIASRGIAGNDPVKRLFQPSPVEKTIAARRGWKTAATAGFAVSIGGKSREELYAFWRDFTNLPKFMENLDAVEVLDDKRSVWHVKAPGGRSIQWTSTVTEEVPGHSYKWESAGDVRNAGSVEFRDGPVGRGTEVRLGIKYEPPFGQFGRIAAKWMRHEPAIQARMDLKRFKMLMEAGEVSTAKINPAASNAA